MENVILTDVDGVLLEWSGTFDNFIYTTLGLKPKVPHEFDISKRYDVSKIRAVEWILMFERTLDFGNLPSYGDSIKYVRKLHEEYGFKFITISAVADSYSTYKLRSQNLRNLYGEVFIDFIHTGFGGDKRDALERFSNGQCNYFYVDDHPKHIAEAIKQDHIKPILMRSHHIPEEERFELPPLEFLKVTSWKQIYEYVQTYGIGV